MTGFPHSRILLAVAAPLLLAACAAGPSLPPEPTVDIQPGARKSTAAFHADEDRCRLKAEDAVGGRAPGEAAADSTVRSAALGTALGAGAGALIGSTSGQAGQGAAIGAASGLLFGTAAGAGAAARSADDVQRRYDRAYARCMEDAGNRVVQPVRERVVYEELPPRRVVVEEETVVYRSAPPVAVYGGYWRGRW